MKNDSVTIPTTTTIQISIVEAEIKRLEDLNLPVDGLLHMKLERLKIIEKWEKSGLLEGIKGYEKCNFPPFLGEHTNPIQLDDDPPHIQLIKNKPKGTY